MKLLFTVWLLSILPFTLFAQEDIYWEKDQVLTWENYKGSKPANMLKMHAMTASGIEMEISGSVTNSNASIRISLLANFSQVESWSEKQHQNDKLLAHEQLHFHITELFTRKLRKRIREYTFSSNFQDELNQLYAEAQQNLSDYQDAYDVETNHSNVKEKQQAWWDKVIAELDEFDAYQDPIYTFEVELK